MADKKIKKDKETKVDKQIRKYIPFALMLVGLAVLFVVLYYLFQGLGTVEYKGLTFTREKIGEILVYTYNYYVKSPEGRIVQNTLYIRHDPRKNEVPIETQILYPAGRRVMISINATGLTECEDSMIAVATLTNFLAANNLPAKGGTPDEEEAKRTNATYVSCLNYPANPVISIRAADETKITRTNLCYHIDVANCEIQQAIEKFVVYSIIDAKEDASA
jgi:hypothetical protein